MYDSKLPTTFSTSEPTSTVLVLDLSRTASAFAKGTELCSCLMASDGVVTIVSRVVPQHPNVPKLSSTCSNSRADRLILELLDANADFADRYHR